MNTKLQAGILCMLLIVYTNCAIAQNPEIEALRAELNLLRQDYKARIDALERRLENAERSSPMLQNPAPVSMAARSNQASNSAFNPAIGVIFQGQVWSHDNDPEDYAIQGFPFGGEAGPFSEGLATGEAEINISANIDDKFTAWLTVPVVIEGGEAEVEIEEAWVETTALPAGLSSRFGRFFSSIAYLNNKHAHSWDFADQPLPYQVFLGDQYLDDGVQLRWVAPTDLYIEAGAEVFRGDRFPSAGADRSGFGSDSIFLNMGGDIAADHSWLLGLSRLNTRAVERATGDENDPHLFTGDTETSIAEFVWKWAPNGNWKQRNLVFQSGLFWNEDQGEYKLNSASALTNPALIHDSAQRGWYAQTVYQPVQGYRLGARIDGLSKYASEPEFNGSILQSPLSDPRRYSLMAEWSNSEFSRLRLQYMRDESGSMHSDQWGLQYIFSIGAHGGHSF